MSERVAKSVQAPVHANDAAKQKRQKPEPAQNSEAYFPDALAGSDLRLFRKASCACGGGCPSCQAKSAGSSDLKVSSPDDAAEIEADQIADRVMRMPADTPVKVAPVTVTPQRSDPEKLQAKCGACGEAPETEETEEDVVSRREKDVAGDAEPGTGMSEINSVINSGGQALDSQTRDFFEPKFGRDFSGVRIHTGERAAGSAQDLNAHAYTLEHNIVFGRGQYQPETSSGKQLLAHELAHVVQQRSGAIQPKRIHRAVVTVNGRQVRIDYSNIIYETDYLAGAQAQITSFTGTAPTPAVIARITALSESQQRWLLYGLDILSDNTTAAHSALNRTDAVDRLITFAPSATTQPLGGNPASTQQFAREVLIFSGWTDVALTAGLTAPTAAGQSVITPILNPPATGGAAPGTLNAVALEARLVPALTTLLSAQDPSRRVTVATQPMGTIRAIGDLVFAEARSFFSPYSDASRSNVFNLNPTWVASANISDTTTLTPGTAERISFLTNRANIVGRNSTPSLLISDTDIYADTNYDGSRTADQTALLGIMTTMEADPLIQPIVDRLIQHTGFQVGSGAATRIGINPEFDSSNTTECAARWKTIYTLCHEVLHALSHPDFDNAVIRVSSGLVVTEGFTEVLGNQLFNRRVITKAASDPAFKTSLEAGLSVPSCTAPTTRPVGYRDAGSGAETIRSTVGDNNFRAAYFLGRTDLIGI